MSSHCAICLASDIDSPLDSHHTIPQSRGGKNSRQVLLCKLCHGALHYNALYVCSQIRRNKKRSPKNFWKTEESFSNAQPYLEILVSALMTPIPKGCSREHLLSTPVSTEVFENFLLLQNDLGLKSQEAALQYCVQFTLSHIGIGVKNEENDSGTNSLWFLRVPQKG